MAEKIRDVMHANLFEVFNERDPQRRIAAIAKTYTADVVFSDPDEIVTGREALNTKAQHLLDKAPGFVFTAAGPIYENHDLGYLAWHFGPVGQTPVVSGMDIALVQEGRIATLYTLLTS
ncbi:MAG TPA: nuclear transport factor 2 family protein [Ktedonobacteraceae bacterium]